MEKKKVGQAVADPKTANKQGVTPRVADAKPKQTDKIVPVPARFDGPTKIEVQKKQLTLNQGCSSMLSSHYLRQGGQGRQDALSRHGVRQALAVRRSEQDLRRHRQK